MNKEISRIDFERNLVKNHGLAIVQLKTNWNGACQIIEPVFNNLASMYCGSANFFTLDVENEHTLLLDYGITELPVILFFHSGRIIDHAIGLTPRNVLIAKIENAIKNNLS